MNNPLTTQVESRLGATYVALLALFFIGLIFISLKNFNSDVIVIESDQALVKTISNTERLLIANWIKENDIQIPAGEGYRYVVRLYPDKPWIK